MIHKMSEGSERRMKCPVCTWEHPSMLCPRCGFDSSRDYEKYPTFGIVEKSPAVSALRRAREKKQESEKPAGTIPGETEKTAKPTIETKSPAVPAHRKDRTVSSAQLEAPSVSHEHSTYQEATVTSVSPTNSSKNSIPDLSMFSVCVMCLDLLVIVLPPLIPFSLPIYLILQCIVYVIDLAIITSMAVKSHTGKWTPKDADNRLWLGAWWAFLGWGEIQFLMQLGPLPSLFWILVIITTFIRFPLGFSLIKIVDSTNERINLSKLIKPTVYYVLFILIASGLLSIARLVGLVA